MGGPLALSSELLVRPLAARTPLRARAAPLTRFARALRCFMLLLGGLWPLFFFGVQTVPFGGSGGEGAALLLKRGTFRLSL